MLLNPPKWNGGGGGEDDFSFACQSFVGLCPTAALLESLLLRENVPRSC